MNTYFLLNTVMPVLLVAGVACVFVWLLNNDMKNERESRQILQREMDRFEAEKLSKKLKDSKVEIAVKKPQSFTTKRKTQKKG
jgi:hypothetical protein